MQLSGLIDSLSIDEMGLRKHLKEEIGRQKFQTMLGIETMKIHLHDIDLKNYAKHALNNGVLEEKRAILSHLKDRLVIAHGVLTLEK